MHVTTATQPTPAKPVKRLAALAFVSLSGVFLLAGCSNGPEVDPIFKVVPPSQQYNCGTGAPDCMPTGAQGAYHNGY